MRFNTANRSRKKYERSNRESCDGNFPTPTSRIIRAKLVDAPWSLWTQAGKAEKWWKIRNGRNQGNCSNRGLAAALT